MKTIKQRVEGFIASQDTGDVRIFNRPAMIYAHKPEMDVDDKEMSLWNKPDKTPDSNRLVLTRWMSDDGPIEVMGFGFYDGGRWHAQGIIYPKLFTMIGWREIHE